MPAVAVCSCAGPAPTSAQLWFCCSGHRSRFSAGISCMLGNGLWTHLGRTNCQDAIYTVGTAAVRCCQPRGNAKETVLTQGWIHKNYKHFKSPGVCVTECMKIIYRECLILGGAILELSNTIMLIGSMISISYAFKTSALV